MPTINQLCEWVEALTKMNGVDLSPRDKGFVLSMMDRIEMFGDRVKFTEEQETHITTLYSEAVGDSRR